MYIILDNGHGGTINGKYQTAGKRSPKWPDGSQLFEGVYNREIVGKLRRFLCMNEIEFEILVPEQTDVSLSERVRRVNSIYKKRKDAVLISVHADAFSKESANGFSVYTSPGKTRSDGYAKIISEKYEKNIPEIRNRGIKEANFYILKRTHCPAVLIETGFMTNKKDCKFLMSNHYRIARAIYEGIESIVND